MNIDERLEFLTQSTESLHASCQELHAAMAVQAEANKVWAQAANQQAEANRLQAEENKRLDARERGLRSAMLDGIAAFLRGLNDENGGNNAEA
jgi:hypothetical protein